MEQIIQLRQGKSIFEGRVTYEEGDLVQCTFTEKPEVPVGEPVTCMITKNFDEIYHFDGVVLAREDCKLFIFHSPSVVEFRAQRRRYPRFDVELDGWICSHERPDRYYSLLKVRVINISLGGVAFRCKGELPIKSKLTFYTELYGRAVEDGKIEIQLEVLHMKQAEGFEYGCKVVSISSKSLHKLRKYLLQRQLYELKD